MKAHLLPIVLAAAFGVSAPRAVGADYRPEVSDIAKALREAARDLKNAYRDHLKKAARWEPVGHERELWELIEEYERNTERVRDAAKDRKKFGRFTEHLESATALAGQLDRSFQTIRSSAVRGPWQRNLMLLNELSRYAEGGGRRYDPADPYGRPRERIHGAPLIRENRD